MKVADDILWSILPPTEPGHYWFYGDPEMGTMGCDYDEDPEPIKAKMYLIEIWKTGGGSLVATGDGRFLTLNQFDKLKKRSGYVGYWRKADINPPTDFMGVFK